MKILVIADVHGNVEALNSIITAGLGYEELFHIGDLVDYGPDPLDCIAKLKDCIHVRGNHDEAIVYDALPHPSLCGPYKDFARDTVSLSRTLLGAKEIEWLSSLPFTNKFKKDGKVFYLVHGTPRSPLYEYFNPDTADAEIWKIIGMMEADFVIMGHTHKPFIKKLRNKTVFNPGSVGQPRDGDWRASYALVDTTDSNVYLLKSTYNVELVCRRLKKRGFPSYLQYVLRTGKMPRIDKHGNVLKGTLVMDSLKIGS